MRTDRPGRHGAGPLIIMAGSIVGLAASLYGYFAPLTGITGTPGALLVAVASVALFLDGLFLMRVSSRGARGLWLTLGFVGAILTLVAGFFLHAWVLMAAMAVVLVGLIVAMLVASPTPSSSKAFA